MSSVQRVCTLVLFSFLVVRIGVNIAKHCTNGPDIASMYIDVLFAVPLNSSYTCPSI